MGLDLRATSSASFASSVEPSLCLCVKNGCQQLLSSCTEQTLLDFSISVPSIYMQGLTGLRLRYSIVQHCNARSTLFSAGDTLLPQRSLISALESAHDSARMPCGEHQRDAVEAQCLIGDAMHVTQVLLESLGVGFTFV